MIGEEDKKHHVSVQDFSTYMYHYKLHRGRKQFCRFCLQAFSTEEMSQYHIKDCLKINEKHLIKLPTKGQYIKFKNFERKTNSPFIMYGLWRF